MELTTKVLIDNLCAWPVYFKRMNGAGDIRIPANVKNYAMLDVAEVQMQIQAGNNMFIGNGVGNHGDHARLLIVDTAQRKELLGYGAESSQDATVLTVETVKELFAIRKREDFMNKLEALVVTPAEKKMILQVAKDAGGDEVSAWKMDAVAKLASEVEI